MRTSGKVLASESGTGLFVTAVAVVVAAALIFSIGIGPLTNGLTDSHNGTTTVNGKDYSTSTVSVSIPTSCNGSGPESNSTYENAYFSIYYNNAGCLPGGPVLGGYVRDPTGSSGFFNLSARLAHPEWFTPSGGAGVDWSGGKTVELLVAVATT